MSVTVVHEVQGALLLSAISITILLIGELIGRSTPIPPEVTRKVAHVGSGVVVLLLPVMLESAWTVMAMAAGFGLLLGGTHIAGLLPSVHDVNRGIGGVVWYPIAAWLCYVLAFEILHTDYRVYAIAVFVLALADTAGAVVGRRWGLHHYPAGTGHLRTIEGSLAVAVATLACVAVPLALGDGRVTAAEAFLVAYVTAVAVAVAEGVSRWGADNVSIPLVALVVVNWCTQASQDALAAAAAAATFAGVSSVLVALMLTRSSTPTLRLDPDARVRSPQTVRLTSSERKALRPERRSDAARVPAGSSADSRGQE